MDETILFVSEQQMYKIGNQVLPECLKGYLRAGFRVVLLTKVSDESRVMEPEEFPDGLRERIRVIRFTPLFEKWIRWFKERGFLRKKVPGPDAGVLPGAVESFEVLRAYPALLSLVPLLSFTLGAVWAGRKLRREYPICLVCGFETHGAPAAWVLAKAWGLPLVTKYQGSFLTPSGPSRWNMFLRFPAHFLGTFLGADLVQMENDGHRGLDVLEWLGHNPARLRFRIAGVPRHLDDGGVPLERIWGKFGIPYGEKTRIVLGLSKLSKWKRVDRAVRAMKEVVEQIPEAWLVLAHQGPEREALSQCAREAGVSDRVLFLGGVPHQEALLLMRGCDVYISTNSFTNLGIPVLEALRCGKPVVTIDDGSTVGFMEHGRNAFLVPRERIRKELPAAIIRLLGDDALRARFGEESFRIAEQKLLTWEERMELEVAEIRALLSAHRGARPALFSGSSPEPPVGRR